MNTMIRRGSYIPRARAIANSRRKEQTNKRPIIRILIIQSMICIMIALLCMGVKAFQLPFVQAFENNLKYLLTYTIDFQQSINNIQQTFLNYLPSQQVNNSGENADDTV